MEPVPTHGGTSGQLAKRGTGDTFMNKRQRADYSAHGCIAHTTLV